MAETLRFNGIEGVIFDFNGTLRDWGKVVAQDIELARRHYGRTITAEGVMKLMGGTPQEVYAGLTGIEDISGEQIELARDRMAALSPEFPKRPIDGVVEALSQLHRAGISMGIVTGGRPDQVELDLAQMQLPPVFDFIHTGAEVGPLLTQNKPAYAAALDHFRSIGIAPGHVLAVGDEPNNMKDARAAGLGDHFVIIPSTMDLSRIVRDGVPENRIIHSIGALPGVLGIEAPPTLGA